MYTVVFAALWLWLWHEWSSERQPGRGIVVVEHLALEGA